MLIIFALPLVAVLVVPVVTGETWAMFTYLFLYILLVVFMALNDLRWNVIPSWRRKRP